MFKQLDIVQLITTRNVIYMSGPQNAHVKPHGQWSVVSNIGNELLLSKDSTLIRIPSKDVVKIASYDPESFLRRRNG